jgi:hypothetical protein
MPSTGASVPGLLGTSIRLFLADGTPDGLWVVEKSNWTGLALMAPRSRYPALRLRPEMMGPGVYVLVGPEGGAKSIRIYVGETDVLKDRLDAHQKNKDFWTKAVVFTSKDANLNKAHVRYLEARLLAIAAEANRAELDNGSATTLPGLSEADRADMESFLADMLTIYPVLGISAFERAAEATQAAASERLYLTGKATAEGQEASDGFVVFKNALARSDSVPSIHAYIIALRESLTAAGVLVVDGEHLRLTQDYLFSSPSNAAMVLLGRTANGRIEWKTKAGVTLKELQEQAIDRG